MRVHANSYERHDHSPLNTKDCDHPTIPGVPSSCPSPSQRRNNSEGPDGQTECFCPHARMTVGGYYDQPTPAPAFAHATTQTPRSCAYGGLTPKKVDFNAFNATFNSSLGDQTESTSHCLGGTSIGVFAEGTDRGLVLQKCCDAVVAEGADGYAITHTNTTPDSFACRLLKRGHGREQLPNQTVLCGDRDDSGPRVGGSWNWEVSA